MREHVDLLRLLLEWEGLEGRDFASRAALTFISRRVGAEGKKAMDQAQKLRELAAWYREFAERAGSPWIWDARLKTADKLEKEAALLEPRLIQIKDQASVRKA